MASPGSSELLCYGAIVERTNYCSLELTDLDKFKVACGGFLDSTRENNPKFHHFDLLSLNTGILKQPRVEDFGKLANEDILKRLEWIFNKYPDCFAEAVIESTQWLHMAKIAIPVSINIYGRRKDKDLVGRYLAEEQIFLQPPSARPADIPIYHNPQTFGAQDEVVLREFPFHPIVRWEESMRFVIYNFFPETEQSQMHDLIRRPEHSGLGGPEYDRACSEALKRAREKASEEMHLKDRPPYGSGTSVFQEEDCQKLRRALAPSLLRLHGRD